MDPNRQVFQGNGYRLLEVHESDVGWNFSEDYRACRESELQRQSRSHRSHAPRAKRPRPNAFYLVGALRYTSGTGDFRTVTRDVEEMKSHRLYHWGVDSCFPLVSYRL